jgi:hypothetical protein
VKLAIIFAKLGYAVKKRHNFSKIKTKLRSQKMKKFVLTFVVICLFSVGASAGWIHTTRSSTCDPATSEPGTCIWVEENNHRTAQPDHSDP